MWRNIKMRLILMCANMARGVGPACQAYNTGLFYTLKKPPRFREGG